MENTPTAPAWVHGRGSLTWEDDAGDRVFSVGCEWETGAQASVLAFGLSALGEEQDLALSLGIPRLFTVYLGTRFMTFSRAQRVRELAKRLGVHRPLGSNGLDIFSLRVSPGGIDTFVTLALWSEEHWDSDKERRRWSAFPIQVLTGGKVFEKEQVVKDQVVTVCLPESDYDLRVRICRSRRRWRRAPLSLLPASYHWYTRVDVVNNRVVDGNKGLRGISTDVTTVADAVGVFLAHVAEDRNTAFTGNMQWGRKNSNIRVMAKAVMEDVDG